MKFSVGQGLMLQLSEMNKMDSMFNVHKKSKSIKYDDDILEIYKTSVNIFVLIMHFICLRCVWIKFDFFKP